MAFLHQLSLETFGIGGRKFLKRMVGLNPRPQAYKDYKYIMTDYQKRINSHSCTKIDIVKTFEEIAGEHGFQRETLETLQNVEFMEHFHRFLGSKGYNIPKELVFMEYRIPSGSWIAAETLGNTMVYNPRSLKNMDFRIPIHETGHLMHKKLGQLAMRHDYYKQSFGDLMHKIGLFKNFTFNYIV